MDKIAKAIVGGLVPAYALYQVATGASSPAGSGVTGGEWVAMIVTGLFAGLAVWAVPNAPASSTLRPPTTGG